MSATNCGIVDGAGSAGVAPGLADLGAVDVAERRLEPGVRRVIPAWANLGAVDVAERRLEPGVRSAGVVPAVAAASIHAQTCDEPH